MCLLPVNVPVGVVLAFPARGCAQNSHFCDKCMWHVRVCLIHTEIHTNAPRGFVAQDQKLEVLPVGDLLQLCLITELVFPGLQNQGGYLGKILSCKGWRLSLHRGACLLPAIR